MFNKDFFPTPIDVIQFMINGDIKGKVILEPSAGKGDIVDFCINEGAEVLACEIHPDLAKIVQKKATRFLKDDFMKVLSEEISHIDAIYMNPPFSADEKHILHAWNIAPSGCHIVALCNWQTLSNDYSRSRHELLSIIKNYGHSTNLGDVFSSSERSTGVEIGLVNLYKPKTDDDFSGYFDEGESEEEHQENGIMSYNAIRDVVNSYVGAIKLYDQVLENGVRMNDLVGKFSIPKELSFSCTIKELEKLKIEFVKGLQKQAWTWIFGKMDMGKYVTKKLKEDLNKFVEKQVNVPFTMKNIYKMFELVVGTHEGRMDKALEEVFDKLTQHYHENRYNVEGWKTNSHYIINKKFIMPYAVGMGYSGEVEVNWGRGNSEILDDLHKALCYLTGNPIQKEDGLYTFYRHHTENSYVHNDKVDTVVAEYTEKGFVPVTVRPSDKNFSCVNYTLNPKKDFGKWYDWGFFEIKAFKKGTVHCKFKDESVWAKFNRKIASLRGFELPEKI